MASTNCDYNSNQYITLISVDGTTINVPKAYVEISPVLKARAMQEDGVVKMSEKFSAVYQLAEYFRLRSGAPETAELSDDDAVSVSYDEAIGFEYFCSSLTTAALLEVSKMAKKYELPLLLSSILAILKTRLPDPAVIRETFSSKQLMDLVSNNDATTILTPEPTTTVATTSDVVPVTTANTDKVKREINGIGEMISEIVSMIDTYDNHSGKRGISERKEVIHQSIDSFVNGAVQQITPAPPPQLVFASDPAVFSPPTTVFPPITSTEKPRPFFVDSCEGSDKPQPSSPVPVPAPIQLTALQQIFGANYDDEVPITSDPWLDKEVMKAEREGRERRTRIFTIAGAVGGAAILIGGLAWFFKKPKL